MEYRVQTKQRSPLPKPWHWEIVSGDYDDLVERSQHSYAKRADAKEAGDEARLRLIAKMNQK
jgi:hypothetical protein